MGGDHDGDILRKSAKLIFVRELTGGCFNESGGCGQNTRISKVAGRKALETGGLMSGSLGQSRISAGATCFLGRGGVACEEG